MSKIVKLTQSDIENIVTNIVSEQETGGYQLPDGEITYDTEDDVDMSGELDEVEFLNPDENGNEGEPTGKPVGLALAKGEDGFLYAIDPVTRTVISRIKM